MNPSNTVSNQVWCPDIIDMSFEEFVKAKVDFQMFRLPRGIVSVNPRQKFQRLMIDTGLLICHRIGQNRILYSFRHTYAYELRCQFHLDELVSTEPEIADYDVRPKCLLRSARLIHSTVTDKLPSPSIVTTITSPFAIGPTPAGVPDCMISPDASSKYWLG